MKFLKLRKIRMRLAIIFSIFIVIVLLTVGILMSFIFSREIIEQTSNVAEHKMRIITRDIDEKVSSVTNLYSNIRDNDDIQRLMQMKTKSEQEEYERIRKISKILRQYAYSDISINSIFAFGLDKKVYDPLYLISPYKEIVSENNDFKEFIKSEQFSRFSEPSTFPNKSVSTIEKDKSTITYFVKYLSNEDYNHLGYILINAKKEYMFKDIKKFCQEQFDATYIINEKGKLIYKIGDSDFEDEYVKNYRLSADSFRKIEEKDGKKYLFFNESLKYYPDWKVIGVISYGRVKHEVVLLLKLVYIIAGISVFLILISSYSISKKITDPILKINEAINEFENGEWPEKLEVKTEDELKNLVKGFNRLVERFKELLEKVYREQEEKKKVEITTLELRLELLQSQINPHFVHNTLNAVQYLALKRGADDIREMIQSFNLLLRASMSVGKDFITIKEELDCVKSYLKIQEYRYDNTFTCIYDIEENIKLFKIPKLILQPIVENALYHGIVPKEKHGTIIIKIKQNNNKIRIKVIDDGVGIEKSEQKSAVKNKNDKYNSGFNNIGLSNINARLKLYFGDEYKLEVHGDLGIGTCIVFDIPIID